MYIRAIGQAKLPLFIQDKLGRVFLTHIPVFSFLYLPPCFLLFLCLFRMLLPFWNFPRRDRRVYSISATLVGTDKLHEAFLSCWKYDGIRKLGIDSALIVEKFPNWQPLFHGPWFIDTFSLKVKYFWFRAGATPLFLHQLNESRSMA